MTNNHLGKLIHRFRKEKKLSQKDLAEGICTQPLISSIENGKYIPNGVILIKIFNKLDINLEEINLDNNFSISSDKQIDKMMESLCNSHQYQKLLNLLQDSKTIYSIDTEIQEQAYYYYLAISLLQAQNNIADAIKNLNLSIASSGKNIRSNTLYRLSNVTLAYISSIKRNSNEVNTYIKIAFEKLSRFR